MAAYYSEMILVGFWQIRSRGMGGEACVEPKSRLRTYGGGTGDLIAPLENLNLGMCWLTTTEAGLQQFIRWQEEVRFCKGLIPGSWDWEGSTCPGYGAALAALMVGRKLVAEELRAKEAVLRKRRWLGVAGDGGAHPSRPSCAGLVVASCSDGDLRNIRCRRGPPSSLESCKVSSGLAPLMHQTADCRKQPLNFTFCRRVAPESERKTSLSSHLGSKDNAKGRGGRI